MIRYFYSLIFFSLLFFFIDLHGKDNADVTDIDDVLLKYTNDDSLSPAQPAQDKDSFLQDVTLDSDVNVLNEKKNLDTISNTTTLKDKENNLEDYIGSVNAPLSWKGKGSVDDNKKQDQIKNNNIKKSVTVDSLNLLDGKVTNLENTIPSNDNTNIENVNNSSTSKNYNNKSDISVKSKTLPNVEQLVPKSLNTESSKLLSDTNDFNSNISTDNKIIIDHNKELVEIDANESFFHWSEKVKKLQKKYIPEPITYNLSPLVYKKKYNSDNTHLSRAVYASDLKLMIFNAIVDRNNLAISYLLDLIGSTEFYVGNTSDTPLIFAAKIGNIEAVRILIARGAHLNAENSMGLDVLSIVKRMGKIDLAQEIENLLIRG